MSFQTIMLWVASGTVVYGFFALAVGIWALFTHREKLYRERRKAFDAQYHRVRARLTETRSVTGGEDDRT